MTVTLELEPEVESLLEKRAKADGCDVQDDVKKLIKKEVHRQQTFDEILAPFRHAVEKNGVSDDELDALFTEARKEVFKTKQEKL
jgi:predicted metal-dependent phosphotriesterase family hydrolase